MPIFVLGQLMDQIRRDLMIVKDCVKLNAATGHTDANTDAENFYCGLLNAAFGWQLKNLNALKMDFPAIDLGDGENHICVQVTSTEGREKVRHTLNKFFAHKLHTGAGYERLIVLIIGDKPSYRDPFPVEDGFDFDPERDIWDTAKLVREIEARGLEAAKAVAEYLTAQLNIPRTRNPVLHLPFSALGDDRFVGREDLLAELGEKLRGSANDPIVVWGLGGMGKTVLVTRFCAGFRDRNVYFVRFRESFTQTVAVEVAAGLPGYADRKPDPARDYAEAMALLEQCGLEDILIIDNADEPNDDFGALLTDPAWAQLRKLKLRLILTTRCEVAGAIRVGKMTNETLYQFFEKQELSLDKSQMDDLIWAVDGHTMTVELIAKTLKRSRTLTVDKLLAALRAGNLPEQRVRPVTVERNGEVTQEVIYEHLRSLFNVAEISEEARAVLRNMVLLPEGGMDIEILEAVLDDEKFETLNQQIDHGWLSFDRDTCFVTIHPVIRLVCREELKPDDENCGLLLRAISLLYDHTQYDAAKFRQFAELFSQAAEILQDKWGEWSLSAGRFWNEIGHAVKALPYEVQAVRRLEENASDPEALAIACNNVGCTYSDLGNYRMALEYKLKALAIYENILTPCRSDLAIYYCNVGYAYDHLGDHRQALVYAMKALDIREKTLPRDHTDLAMSYNNVGYTYGRLGDVQKKLYYYQEAMKIWEKALPADHPDLAMSYNNVGSAYEDLGDYEKALELTLKALNICEKVLPDDHPSLARTYHNLGHILGVTGDHEKALEYKLKSAALLEKTLPAEHPRLAESYHNVGITYRNLGDYEKALEYALKTLDIRERTLTAEHTDLAMSYNNVGAVYAVMGDYECALKYVKKALDIAERFFPERHDYTENYRYGINMLEMFLRMKKLGIDVPNPFK